LPSFIGISELLDEPGIDSKKGTVRILDVDKVKEHNDFRHHLNAGIGKVAIHILEKSYV